MKYTIIVDKQPSTKPTVDKKTYTVDIEELRAKGDVYDSLIITKDEDYVMRRLSLSEYHVLSVLDEPVKETIPGLNIELFEGDNYIYLADETGNKFYAEYLIKNEFNDIYVRVNEMNTAINQSAEQIELSVNQKLTGYSTTEEMKAAIALEAGKINQEVSKKVGEDEYTSAQILLMINGDESEAQINANKVNINGAISANGNFKVNTDGTIECVNGIAKENFIVQGSEYNATFSQTGLRVREASDDYSLVTFLGINAMGIYVYNVSEGQRELISSALFGCTTSPRQVYLKFLDALEKNQVLITPDLIQLKSNEDNIELDGKLGNITASSYINANIMRANSFDNYSLKSLKDNICKLNEKTNKNKIKRNALDIIKESDICEYNYKGLKKTSIGLVIGEGYKVPDEVLSEEKDSIDLYSMTSIAWKSIQEISKMMEEYNQKINKLQAIVENQNIEIEKLKKRMGIYENNSKG